MSSRTEREPGDDGGVATGEREAIGSAELRVRAAKLDEHELDAGDVLTC